LLLIEPDALASIKVAGSWKEINEALVKVAGSWRDIDKIYVKIGNAWQQIGGVGQGDITFATNTANYGISVRSYS
jgi:hypothetical protein